MLNNPIDEKNQGSGGLHKTSLWVNVRNAVRTSHHNWMKVAINDWMDFFSVRQV